MTSQRHNTEIPTARDGYLDAARACILDVGWRRTTLTEVARRADVSRMTIYRAWPDMPALLADLMTREWTGVVVGQVAPDRAPTPERLADSVVSTIAALRENELFARIVQLDPELVLPYLLDRRGRSQELIIGLLAEAVHAGQEPGTIRTGEPVAIARGLVLACHGFVLSAPTMTDQTIDLATLDAELHTQLTRSLQP